MQIFEIKIWRTPNLLKGGITGNVPQHVEGGEFRHQRRRKVSRRPCVNIDPQVVALFLTISASSLFPSLCLVVSLHAYMLRKLYNGYTVGKIRAFSLVKYAH